MDRGRQRREEILDAAADLFAVNGFRGTGLAAIADRVGVTQPTVLHHFGNKEGVLLALVERLRDDDAASLRNAITSADGDVLGALPRFASLITSDHRRTHLLTVLVAENLLPGDSAHDLFVEHYKNLRTTIAEGLNHEQAAGRIRDTCNVKVVATRIVAVISGLERQWIRGDKSVDLDRTLTEFASTLRAEMTPIPH